MRPRARLADTRAAGRRSGGRHLAARLVLGLGCLGLGLAGCALEEEPGGDGRIHLDPTGFWGPSAEETGDPAGLLMGRSGVGDYYVALGARFLPAASVKVPEGHPTRRMDGIDLVASCGSGRLALAADRRSGLVVATVEPPPDGGPWAADVGGFVPLLGYSFADGCLLDGGATTFTPLLRDAGGAIEITVAQRTQAGGPIAGARIAEARRAAAYRRPDAGPVGTQPTLNRVAAEFERSLGDALDTAAESLVQTRFAFSSVGPNSPEYLIPVHYRSGGRERFAGALELSAMPRTSRFAVSLRPDTLLPDFSGRGLDVLTDLSDAAGRDLRATVRLHGRGMRAAVIRGPATLEGLCARMVGDLEPFGLSNYDLGFIVHRVLEEARVAGRSVFPDDPRYAGIGCVRRFAPLWQRSGLGVGAIGAGAPAATAPTMPVPPHPAARAPAIGAPAITSPPAPPARAPPGDGAAPALRRIAEALGETGVAPRERALGRALGAGTLILRNPTNLAPLAVAGLPLAGPVSTENAAQGLAAIQPDGPICVGAPAAARRPDGYDGALWLRDAALGWLRLRGAVGRDGHIAALAVDRPMLTDGPVAGAVDSPACRRVVEMLARPRS